MSVPHGLVQKGAAIWVSVKSAIIAHLRPFILCQLRRSRVSATIVATCRSIPGGWSASALSGLGGWPRSVDYAGTTRLHALSNENL